MPLLPLLISLLLPLSALAAPAEMDWLELMPPEDRLALENMPDIIHATPETAGFSDQGRLRQSDRNLPAVMYSAKTVPALNGQTVRLGGYPVPLETDARGNSIEFFLVPYPGACIHVPPPPPNQIVLVRYPKGIWLNDIYEPLWVDGILLVEPVSKDLADAAYALEAGAVRAIEMDEL
ncbi:DUF3299 domain-containing protein [Stutzerimonas tarimensis]|uniref:DUF3299 domain-containing protein n=1 Tax=Stutzerimonas tarimensis TaxID=1507735 RepID=A0ABV7T023_9GAMM